MTRNKLLTALAALAGTLMLGSLPASAAESTTALNVRAGAGVNHHVVDVIHPGEYVEVTRTSGGWCYLRKSGPDGWASCRYLTDTPRRGDRDRRGDRPDVDIEFSIPGFSFSIGDGRIRPGRPGRAARVCFYEHVGYDGDSFCMEPGERRSSLGSWNDRISSIRVRGGAEAQVCEHNGFNGRCVVVDRNIRDLRPRGNDMISSIRVR